MDRSYLLRSLGVEVGSWAQVDALADECVAEIFGPSSGEEDPNSIYGFLAVRLRQCKPEKNDLMALSPGDEVDQTLSRLVRILRGEFSQDSAGWGAALDQLIVSQIEQEPQMQKQADLIRDASALAETAMEYYYSHRIVQRLRRMKAGGRGSGLSSLIGALDGFPYIDSYLELVKGEVSVLPELKGREQAKNLTVALGGCGPLPITGFFIHILTGAKVQLIDSHPSAIARAQELVLEMERLGIISPGMMTCSREDVATLFLGKRAVPEFIWIASLVGQPAKTQLATQMSQVREARQTRLLLRSAKGLCAKLAYKAVETRAIQQSGLSLIGEVVPVNHVTGGLDAHQVFPAKLGNGKRRILDVVPSTVLNSTELYQPL